MFVNFCVKSINQTEMGPPSEPIRWTGVRDTRRSGRRLIDTQAVAELVFGKQATLQTYGLDKYGRTIADVLLPDGTNVNHILVKNGWCWWYRKYAPGDTVLERFEKEAREAKKGLWVDPAPIPPWIYRKARRGQSLDLSDLVPLGAETESGARTTARSPPITGSSLRVKPTHRRRDIAGPEIVRSRRQVTYFQAIPLRRPANRTAMDLSHAEGRSWDHTFAAWRVAACP